MASDNAKPIQDHAKILGVGKGHVHRYLGLQNTHPTPQNYCRVLNYAAICVLSNLRYMGPLPGKEGKP